MRKIILAIAVLAITLVSFTNLEKDTYKAIVEDSVIEWAGSRPGKTHNGTLGITDGHFNFKNDQLVSGDFTLNMKTIKVLDIKPGKSNQKLVDHFNSSDFFDVENHPTGKFVITGSEAKDGKTHVKGNLTIKGITNEVSFLGEVNTNGDGVTLTSDEFKIDRTKWGIKFRSGKFFDNLKNKLIYDDITISVKVNAKK